MFCPEIAVWTLPVERCRSIGRERISVVPRPAVFDHALIGLRAASRSFVKCGISPHCNTSTCRSHVPLTRPPPA